MSIFKLFFITVKKNQIGETEKVKELLHKFE